MHLLSLEICNMNTRSKEICVSDGVHAHSTLSTQAQLNYVSPCTHLEADTRIMVHVMVSAIKAL